MTHVLITGASRGIGLALVKHFLEDGAKVWAISRQVQPAGLSSAGLKWWRGNPLSREFISELKDESVQFDIVIHNAGMLVNKPFAEMTAEDLRNTYETNVFLPYELTQILLPHLTAQAHCIYIGSVGGINGTLKFPGLTSYSSSKAALSCLAECLQVEYADSGWSFNSLALGSAQTEMLKQAFPDFKAQTSAHEMAGFIFRFAKNEGGLVKGKSILVSNGNP